MKTTASQFNVASPTYTFSPVEKLGFLLRGVRQKFAPRKNLIAGPFAGEFGYELMQWQGYIRERRPHYEQVHVITYPGREYIYEGCQVHTHDISLQNAGYSYGRLDPISSLEIARAKGLDLGLKNYDVFLPAMLCTQYHKRLLWKQSFRMLDEPPLNGRVRDVALHIRAIQKEGPDNAKNYSPALADELAQLCLNKGLSVICVGHPDYAYCPKGCEDMRQVDLKQSVAAIHSARLVAGENSGAMHLANLCGQPTVLWANDQWRIDYSLRWNPFDVPIYIAANDTCQPDPGRVVSAIEEALKDLDQRTNGFTKPCYKLPPRQIAYF